MPGDRRAIPASQLARDYSVSLNEFTDAVSQVLAKEWPEPGEAKSPARRPEICAAVSAAMIASLNASMLLPEERDAIHRLVDDALLPFWTKHCASEDPKLAAFITERAGHYLEQRVPGSQVKSAVAIVTELLQALNVPAEQIANLKERLVPAFAHRMVGDVYRINEVRRKHGIELSVLVTVCTLLQMSVPYDSILRVLRIG
jgi:hypothetical protein